MDRPGVRQVPEGSGEQGEMEKTGYKIICGAPTTLAVKGVDDDDEHKSLGESYSLYKMRVTVCLKRTGGGAGGMELNKPGMQKLKTGERNLVRGRIMHSYIMTRPSQKTLNHASC